MNIFLGSIKEKGYNVYFLHKRTENIESEFVMAKNEKEAIKLATIKHRQTYPNVSLSIFKVK